MGVLSSNVALGNLGHAEKRCRPCAFFHAQGCQSGEACQFCHLCPPREAQRRKRLRRRLAREQEARESGLLSVFGERLKQSFSKPVTDSSSCPKPSIQLSAQSFMNMVPEKYATSLNALGSLSNSIVPAGVMQPLVPVVAKCASSFRQFTCAKGDTPPSASKHPAALPTLLTSASTKKLEIQGGCGLPTEVSDSEDGSPTPFRCVTDLGPLEPPLAPLLPTVHKSAEIPQRHTGFETRYMLVPVSVPVPMAAMHVQLQPQLACPAAAA